MKKYHVSLPPTTEVFSCPFGIMTRFYEQLFESQMKESESGLPGMEQAVGPGEANRKMVARQVDY